MRVPRFQAFTTSTRRFPLNCLTRARAQSSMLPSPMICLRAVRSGSHRRHPGVSYFGPSLWALWLWLSRSASPPPPPRLSTHPFSPTTRKLSGTWLWPSASKPPPAKASPEVDAFANGVLARAKSWPVVFCQIAPWQLGEGDQANLKRTRRNSARLLARLVANLGAPGRTPLLERFSQPLKSSQEKRWLDGLYLDTPGEWDDPYRFFRW